VRVRSLHVSNTREIKSFKLLSIAGVYYRGDAFTRSPLIRRRLDIYLTQIGEGEKKNGITASLAVVTHFYWFPKGNIIHTELQKFISSELEELMRKLPAHCRTRDP
jgi:threonyl-tRNA synthetase